MRTTSPTTTSGTRPTCTRAPRRSTAAPSRSSATSSPGACSAYRRSETMDLELSDEQRWLGESVDALLAANWTPEPGAPAGDAPARAQLWRALVDFGALTVGGDDGLGAIELCLVARALGARLAPVPYLGSAAVRFAGVDAGEDDAVAVAGVEPRAGWGAHAGGTPLGGAYLLRGRQGRGGAARARPR